ncbi:PCI domain protein [Oesophagostomum dentatum]|uniref:PCI domain protein n=1 Tax=Oesophagostomum dentatum TaxID=61180 RepID=A0A0B1T3Q8_OESDE|nr:PCI domain protein [Oesophagostomum dentatum]
MLRAFYRVVPRTTAVRYLSTEKPEPPKKEKVDKEEIMKKKTPSGKLDEMKDYEDPYLKKHPGGVNPITGEIGGPAGPEPTRYDMTTVAAKVCETPESAIEYAITNPRILNVSEMLTQPSIQGLQQSNPTLFKTLEVFAYGTVKDLPEGVNLPPAALRKLQQLSLITLAANSTSNRQLPYTDVMQYLGISSVRELEDVVIDAIYNKLIKARLDSKGQFVEVDDWASRDTPASSIPNIISVLSQFAQSATDVRQHTLEDADRRDAQVTADRKRAQQAEADLMAARKALDESVLATMNSHDPSTSARVKASRSARQRPGQSTPASK